MGAGWVERDAAVVWHGFTQMGAYADNAPLVVDRAEGRELIDVDGRRYLDAISSLWVNTLGHRVPELDAALVAQVDKVAHSTMLGNGNTVVVELAEALAPLVPVEAPHFLFAADGAVAVEQALKIAFQYWANRGWRGAPGSWPSGTPITATPSAPCRWGTAGCSAPSSTPCASPSCARRATPIPAGRPRRAPPWRPRRASWPPWSLSRWCRGRRGCCAPSRRMWRALGRACRAHGVLLVCDEVATGFGRTGTLFASEQCGLRPDLLCLGKGITGGYLPMSATVASGAVFDAFLGPDLGPQTFFHGHSYGGNALAAAVALEHLRLMEAWGVLARVRERSVQLADLLARRIAPRPGVGAVRQRGLMVGVELAPPGPGLRWGRRVCAGAVARGVLLRPLGDVVVLMPPLTTTADEILRIVDALEEALREVIPA